MGIRFMRQVVFPLLGNALTVLIMITTLSTRWNACSEFLTLRRPDGSRVFNVVRSGLVCERCKGTVNEDKCKHPPPAVPSWKDEDYDDRLAPMYGEDREAFGKEVNGSFASDDETCVFLANALTKLFDSPEVPVPGQHFDEIFVGFDPNGCGVKKSHVSWTALVSFFYIRDKIFVRYDSA